MTTILSLSVLAGFLVGLADADDGQSLSPKDNRFRIDVTGPVLTDVPVPRVVFSKLRGDGRVDRSFGGRPTLFVSRSARNSEQVAGGSIVRLSQLRDPAIYGIRWVIHGRPAKVPPFENGVLKLETDLAVGCKIYVTAPKIIIEQDGAVISESAVQRIWCWLSLLPPVMAILLAIWWRRVIPALFLAVWCGALILRNGDVVGSLVNTVHEFLVNGLIQPEVAEKDHLVITLFTMFLGALIGVMSKSGATAALVNRLARFTSTRERGQMLTCLMGLVVFFDDYANTLLLGSTMRPVVDRLRISREKLAFLVDSTAAPVAGLALVSTWVGFEVGQISEAFAGVGVEVNAFSVFVSSLPYRFYAIYLVLFVWMIAGTGRDFGPMLQAERRSLERDSEDNTQRDNSIAETAAVSQRPLIRNALIPLTLLIALLMFGLWWTGTESLGLENVALRAQGETIIPVSVSSILRFASGNRVLFVSSLVASLIAVLSASATRALTWRQSLRAWMDGAKSMLGALLILMLAWGVANVCDLEHLNTAGFLVELTQGKLAVQWMPALSFVLAAGVSFATGSSFSTMGLLMPLSVALTYHLLGPLGQAAPQHPLMLGTIGAVLAGAIFGDHCSPISDTTVLSSAAAGCDHFAHVATQMPYAACVALVACGLGYVPVGFRLSPVLLIPLGSLTLLVIVRTLGKRAAIVEPARSE